MRLNFPATVLAFMAALWVKAIYPASSGIADTDFYWHVTYGQWMLENRMLPPGDTFSWTFNGAPYQLTQWLGELAMGLAYNVAELDGTKALSVLLTAVTIGFAWRGAARFVHTSMALGIALVCNLVNLVTPMRPQLFSFALLAASSYLVVSWLETGKRRYLMVFPPMLALWVNLHGAFVVGLLMLGLLAVGVTGESWKAGTLRQSYNRLLWVWGTLAASTLATLVNPYGFHALLNVVMIGGLRSSSVISEWMPVNLTTELGWFYLMNMVPFVAIMTVSGAKPRLTHGLIAGFFLTFGVLANRQVAMCAAVMAPFTAALLARTANYQSMARDISNPSRPMVHGVIAAVLIGSVPAIAAKGDGNWAATMNLQYPIKATDFIVANHLDQRVLSDTLESSYLIHRRIPVFVDGRMDLYRDAFFFQWYLASRGAPGWDVLLDEHKPSCLLLRQDMALRQTALAGGQWKQIFQDARYSVLVPSSSSLDEVPVTAVAYIDKDGRPLRPYMP